MNPLESNSDSPFPAPAESVPGPLPELPSPTPPLRNVEDRPAKEVLKKEKDKEDRDKEKDKEREKEDREKQNKKEKEKEKEKEKSGKRKKEFKKAAPWQRYKALLDSLKESQDLVDLADHKARFALLIMGALNAAIIILATRSDILSGLPENLRVWLYLYFGVYAAIAIYFLVQAIESLRPRSLPAIAPKGTVSEKEENLGLRFFLDALRYDRETYTKAWQSVRISQLNAELAAQLHTLARINKAKYNAVAKLYLGLQAITVLTAGLMVALGAAAWMEHQRFGEAATPSASSGEERAKGKTKDARIKSGKPSKGGWSILGDPEHFAIPGVREPSGIVYAPASGTLFVVGDEGTLVEVSAAGRVVARIPSGGNLEDVAVHTPSGRLVLLSEKKGELLVVDPTSGKRTGRFKLDDVALLGEAGVDKNQGFEGVAFREEEGRPGGGVFYLVHQRAPAMLILLAFDPLAPSGNIGAASLIARTAVPNRADLTAVTYDADLDRVFVIADSKDRLVMLSRSGEEEAEIVLPGAQQEGLSFDPEGNLWIADDRAGLLVFRGARAKIDAEMRAPHPETAPAEKPS